MNGNSSLKSLNDTEGTLNELSERTVGILYEQGMKRLTKEFMDKVKAIYKPYVERYFKDNS